MVTPPHNRKSEAGNPRPKVRAPVLDPTGGRGGREPFPTPMHEMLYALKTLLSGSFLVHHVNITVDRFAHCNFTPGEAIGAFALMLLYAGDLDMLFGVGSVLQGEALVTFEHLAQQHQIPYQLAGRRLQAQRRQR